MLNDGGEDALDEGVGAFEHAPRTMAAISKVIVLISVRGMEVSVNQWWAGTKRGVLR